MTELMKRHIEEGGDCKIAVYVSCALPNVKRYIEWLEAQLTWRPASEKPKDGQIVFAMIPTGWVVSQYLHGKFYIEDGFTFGDLITGVTHWLPIPPAPEVKV
jgi:hypothetical protein